MEAQYTKMRTDLLCVVDVGDLKTVLMEADELSKFDWEKFETAFGDKDCVQGYDKQPFRVLSDLYNKRKDQVSGLRSFHGYAKKHPGMEHKGGVPRGGTFVLVYQEREASEEERRFATEAIVEQMGEVTDELISEVAERVARVSRVVGRFLPAVSR